MAVIIKSSGFARAFYCSFHFGMNMERILNITLVDLFERLKSIPIVNKNSANFVLMKATKIATNPHMIGKTILVYACLLSTTVYGEFSIEFEFST